MLFSRRFSRTCLEGISFKFFVCFILNVSLGSAPKRKNFDIQRNTRVGSGGQFTSNRLSNDHIFIPQKPSCSSITWREAEHICCSGLIPLLLLKSDLSMFKLMTSKISVNINILQILSLIESLPGKRRI